MLGGAWLIVAAVLLLVSAILRQPPILLMAVLLFLASGISWLWAKYALARVQHERRVSAGRVFFGETVTLEVSIANRKMLPLPWVHIEEEVPEEVEFLKGRTSPSYKPTRATLSSVLSLGWYHRLSRRYPVQCLRRGYYTFGPAIVRSADIFGFYRREAVDETVQRLLVYPRIVPLEKLGIPSRDPFGDLRVRRHLFEDPVRVVSTRDYSHGDPLKRIHWKATARVRRLQSRVFEPTTSVDMGLFLDTRTVPRPMWGVAEQLLETGVMVAASVADFAAREGYRVGLYVNEPYRYTARLVRLPPSEHPDQLQRVLEALAHVQGFPQLEMELLLGREGRSLPWGATLVVVTAAPGDTLLAALNRFKRAGRRVALILVGDGTPRLNPGGIPVYHVSDQVYWREVESMRLASAEQGGGSRAR